MPKSSRQTTAPQPFSMGALSEDHWNQLYCRFLTKEIVIVRYLLSKIVSTELPLTSWESVALFLAWEKVVIKSTRDSAFHWKYSAELFRFRAVLQQLDELTCLDPKLRFSMLSREHSDYQGKLVSRRFFYSIEGQLQQLLELKIRKRWSKRFPPKAYIGKGYGDHGTARDSAFDGSPGWKEVAMSKSNSESSSNVEIQTNEDVFSNHRVHPSQLMKTGKPLTG